MIKSRKKDNKDRKYASEATEPKTHRTIEERFAALNRPLGPKETNSFSFLPKPLHQFRRYSAPADLLHDSIVFKHRDIQAFEPCKQTPEPNIFLKSILSKCDLLKLIHAADEIAIKEIFDEIFKKEFPNDQQRKVLTDLLATVFIFCKHESFSNLCIDTLIKMFYYTHKHLISSLSKTADEIYLYFKKLTLLHSVLNPPDSIRIFSPYEAQKSLLIFCKYYMRHLPLIRAICVPTYILEINPQIYPVHPLLAEKGT